MPRKPKDKCIQPEGRTNSYFANTRIYKYLCGHVVNEVALKLPAEKVICWYDGRALSLPVCATNKFMRENAYCKKCPLFQDDEHSKVLCEVIEDWECDEMEDENGS